MSDYRLLIDWEVLEQIGSLPARTRHRIRTALLEVAASPDRSSHYQESGPRGISLEVYVSGDFAIKYWIDFPDRHVKVLGLVMADR